MSIECKEKLDLFIDFSRVLDIINVGVKRVSYSIGPRLKKFREAKHLTQKQFGNLLHVSDARISNWENGVNRPDVDILVKICEILEVSADVLLDIRLKPEDMTEQERRMLMAYRAKPEMQNAVNILLDIHE